MLLPVFSDKEKMPQASGTDMRKKFAYYRDFEDLKVGSSIELNAKVDKRELAPDVFEYCVDLQWDAAEAREKDAEAAVIFRLPCIDLQYMWYPDCRARRVLDADWRLKIRSMLTDSAPMAMLFNGAGINTFTFAADEVRKVTSVEFGVQDEGGSSHIAGKIELGLRQFVTRDHTTLRIRADFRRVPCHEAVDGVREWWENVLPVTPMEVPKAARMPLYSSWYNFHKEIDDKTLEQECVLAKQLGMETIIVDDGWQTGVGGTGYGYTGDWEPYPEKFPDIRRFVDNVHKTGMKVMMWYSVPFVGYYSKNWERFKGMILRREDRNSTGILDPRYPEVREFLKGIYLNALENYGLDGLKLDFIDRIQKPDFEEMQPGMDFECVQEATDFMMNDIIRACKEVRPDLLIEFRQRYIGPCMRQFGNMFRVSDCPADIATNRMGMMDLRMLNGNTAIHSDMITWHPDDKIEDAALQVLNTVFGVTQVSKILSTLKPDEWKMLSFWMDFEHRNMKVLQESGLVPYEPQFLYPVIRAYDGTEEIIGVYADSKIVRPDLSLKKTQLINACWQPYLTLRTDDDAEFSLKVYDCIGHSVRDEEILLTKGLHEIDVPRSGLAILTRK